jgi:hypothetical protein
MTRPTVLDDRRSARRGAANDLKRPVPSVAGLPLLALVLVMLFIMSAASPALAKGYTVKLSYKPFLETGEATGPAVRLAFVDERLPSRGGADDTALVGTVRGAVGEPWRATNRGDPADKIIRAYVRDVLSASGLKLTKDESAPLVRAAFTDLWIDGFLTYEFELGIRFELVTVDGTIAFTEPVAASVTGDGMNIQAMLLKLLALHSEGVVQALGKPAFKAALEGVSSTDREEKAEPTTPEAAPTQSGCAKDTDCKGDRICRDRECVDP